MSSPLTLILGLAAGIVWARLGIAVGRHLERSRRTGSPHERALVAVDDFEAALVDMAWLTPSGRDGLPLVREGLEELRDTVRRVESFVCEWRER